MFKNRRGGLTSPPLFLPPLYTLPLSVAFAPVASLGYVLVDILHLDHAELDVFMAKLQVRAAFPIRRGLLK